MKLQELIDELQKASLKRPNADVLFKYHTFNGGAQWELVEMVFADVRSRGESRTEIRLVEPHRLADFMKVKDDPRL
jgi:hypothetical protein